MDQRITSTGKKAVCVNLCILNSTEISLTWKRDLKIKKATGINHRWAGLCWFWYTRKSIIFPSNISPSWCWAWISSHHKFKF